MIPRPPTASAMESVAPEPAAQAAACGAALRERFGRSLRDRARFRGLRPLRAGRFGMRCARL